MRAERTDLCKSVGVSRWDCAASVCAPSFSHWRRAWRWSDLPLVRLGPGAPALGLPASKALVLPESSARLSILGSCYC